MAYESNISSAAGHIIADHIRQMVADVRAEFARRRLYRTTLKELRGLTDRELEDLGLNRSILGRVAYEATYQG